MRRNVPDLLATAYILTTPLSQGKYAEAEPLHELSTKIWEKALGLEHPTVATAYNNRAGLLRVQVRAHMLFPWTFCGVQRYAAVSDLPLSPEFKKEFAACSGL